MTHTPDTLAPDRLAYARRVATDPGFAPFAEERANAWAILKLARGQTHCIWRLGPAAEAGALAGMLDAVRARGLRRRILARAAAITRGPDPDPPSAA